MAGDEPSGNGYRLADLLADLRRDITDDIRYQLAEHEKRMNAAISVTDKRVSDFIIDHGKDHEAIQAEQRGNQQRIGDFIAQAQLEKARRDGIFATAVFIFSLLGKHWQVVLAAALVLASAIGAVRVQVGP